MARLCAANLAFQYPGSSGLCLEGIELALGPGTFLVIAGPNGAAKSTLLSLLAGLRAPTGGEVELDGRPLATLRPGELARRLSYAPQRCTVPFAFTAREVVVMGAQARVGGRLRTLPEDLERATQALSEVDADSFAGRVFNELSGGEQQRVIVARSLAQSRDLLLLDEPTSAQDLAHELLIFERFRALARSEAIVAVASHNLAVAARFASTILVLDGGRMAAYGPPSEVLTPELYESVFRVRSERVLLGDGSSVLVPTERLP